MKNKKKIIIPQVQTITVLDETVQIGITCFLDFVNCVYVIYGMW